MLSVLLFIEIYLISPLLYFLFFILNKLKVPFVYKRWQFEQKNFSGESFRFKNKENWQAQIAFEISSEGELELIKPLLDYYLVKKLNVEIIYCSQSVEKKIQELASKYSNLKTLRLPLMSFLPTPWCHFLNIFGSKGSFFNQGQNLSQWVTSQQLVLCRYDFFPEILWLGLHREKFYLFSATLKGKDFSFNFGLGLGKKWFYKQIYSLFTKIYCTNLFEKKRFQEIFGISDLKLDQAELRTMQIRNRIIHKKENVFFQSIYYQELNTWWGKFPKSKRILLGSFWQSDASIFKSDAFEKSLLNGEVLVVVIAHQLGHEERRISKYIRQNLKLKIPCYHLQYENNEKTEEVSKKINLLIDTMNKTPGILFLSFKGILCELYSDFGHAYVGGGMKDRKSVV